LESKLFHIGAVLSVTHDKLLCPSGFRGIQEFLDFMTGESLYTHQLPRAARVCGPYLLFLHPELENIEVPGWVNSEDNLRKWLDSITPIYSNYLDIEPLPEGYWQPKDPIQELEDLRNKR
jgi:hypothetical protein